MSDAAPSEPRRGREARHAARAKRATSYTPCIERAIPLVEILSEDGLATIEANAETLLQEVGVEFRDYPAALKRFRDAGADVSGERVRFPKGLARKLSATAPASYVQHARNGLKSWLSAAFSAAM
ncbi:MAG: trimethylamine methyltransferase family protein [Roseiarcus sp.]